MTYFQICYTYLFIKIFIQDNSKRDARPLTGRPGLSQIGQALKRMPGLSQASQGGQASHRKVGPLKWKQSLSQAGSGL